MVRVGGMTYAIDPRAKVGARISDLRMREKPLEAHKRYKVAGWAPVAAPQPSEAEPVWDVVIRYLRERKTIPPLQPSMPRLIGVAGNPGWEQ
jgi:sulfur-oxidizing protein SoxB